MDTSLDKTIREALHELDRLKSPDCLDDAAIGCYAENQMTDEERRQCEAHLHRCLYCLDRLTNLQELRYYQEHPLPVPDELLARLQSVIPPQEPVGEQGTAAPVRSFGHRLWHSLTWPVTEWRYSAAGLAGATLGALICFAVMRPEHREGSPPQVNPAAFVRIAALGDDGKVLQEAQGVVVAAKGYIASNLHSLSGATTVRVTQHDGTPCRIDKIWADENRDLAVMKLDTEALPVIPASPIRKLVGKSIFHVAAPDQATQGTTESTVSDVFQFPGQHYDPAVHSIRIAPVTNQGSGGALVDAQGMLVGLPIIIDKNLTMAAPLSAVKRLHKTGTAIPMSALKRLDFSPEALDCYLKGVHARDSQQWPEAQLLLEKAVRLNPRLDGAYLELGYVYYRQREYLKEARAYQAALALNPNSFEALLSLAENLESRLAFREAITCFERAQLLEPENTEILFRLGLAYLAQGDRLNAINMSTRLRLLDPGDAEVLRRLAR